MKKQNNIKVMFGPSLDNDVALNNTITVQAKFRLCTEQNNVLYKIMEHLTYCNFIYFNLLLHPKKMAKFMDEKTIVIKKFVLNKTTNLKEEIEIKETLKVAFCRVYGISSRQFNAIDFLIKGLIQSNKTLMDNQLINFNDQLKSKKARLKKLNGQIQLLEISDAFKNNDEDILKSHYKKRSFAYDLNQEINKKAASIKRLSKKVKEGTISVCFGNRKILKRLSSLFNDSDYDSGKYKNISPVARNSYQKAYRKLWNDSRFDKFFLLGSKDENNGNSSCVFSKQSESFYAVRISIPQFVIDQLSLKEKYLTIDNINFKHNEKEILNTLALNHERKLKEQDYKRLVKDNDLSLLDENNKIITKAEYLKDEGVAISFRFIKDTFKDPKRESTAWRILVSMDETKRQKAITSKSNGVIGVDINNNHFAVA